MIIGNFRAVLVGIVFMGACSAQAFRADETSTETRWRLSAADRISSDTVVNGDHYGKRMAFIFEDNARAETSGVVFLGDSLTEGFPVDEAMNGSADATTAPKRFLNRGIGGDPIEGMIERLDVCVRDVHPKTVYVMAGTNDVLWYQNDYKDGNVGVGYERLARRIRELSPGTEVVFQTIPPINGSGLADTLEKWDMFSKRVDMANSQIRETGRKLGIRVVDTHKVLSDAKGYFVPRYTKDGVHLTLLGNLQWIDALDLPKQEKLRVWKNLAPQWKAATDSTRTLTSVNGPRGDDSFVKYTPDGGRQRTGTQQFGIEVTVENDRMTSYTRGWGNGEIPRNGYVLSARGNSSAWLMLCAGVPARVRIDGMNVSMIPDEQTPDLAYEMARGAVLEAMATGKTDGNEYYDLLEKARLGQVDAARTVLNRLGQNR